MGNGGPLQSCFICRWVQTDPDHEQSWKQAYCQRHTMDITRPGHTFCSDLSPAHLPKPLGWLVKIRGLEGNTVYTWVEIQYRTEEYPGLPQYHLEYVPLAPIKVYARWSEAQKLEAIQA